MNKLFRKILVFIGGSLIATLVLCFALTWISYRNTIRGAPQGVILRPERIESPFTLSKGIKASEFEATLKLPIYPGSVADESTVSRWLSTPYPKSGRAEGVALLRLHTEASLARAEGWYKDHLDAEFVRAEGNLAETVEENHWFTTVLRNPNANAVLFLRSQSRTKDGVLLEPTERNEGVHITVFRYGGPQS